MLQRLGLTWQDRIQPEVASTQVITCIDPYQAQLLNRFRRGQHAGAGRDAAGVGVCPCAYINYACNEAEKKASIRLVHVSSVGRFGRMWLSRQRGGDYHRPRCGHNRAGRTWKGRRNKAGKMIPGREKATMKEFYTEKDIEDMAARGVMSLQLTDNVVLTDLAYERAKSLGVALVTAADTPPGGAGASVSQPAAGGCGEGDTDAHAGRAVGKGGGLRTTCGSASAVR